MVKQPFKTGSLDKNKTVPFNKIPPIFLKYVDVLKKQKHCKYMSAGCYQYINNFSKALNIKREAHFIAKKKSQD